MKKKHQKGQKLIFLILFMFPEFVFQPETFGKIKLNYSHISDLLRVHKPK